MCVRKYYLKNGQWLPSKVGFNLSLQEWKLLTSDYVIGIICDAISQLVNSRAPQFKGNLEHEMQEPTAVPMDIEGGYCQHRHMLNAELGKAVVIDNTYCDDNSVRVSLLQFESLLARNPRKGIHLNLNTWDKLVSEISNINRQIESLTA